jgi:hypothetical protein
MKWLSRSTSTAKHTEQAFNSLIVKTFYSHFFLVVVISSNSCILYLF